MKNLPILFAILLFGCSESSDSPLPEPSPKIESIIDVEGNSYKVVEIGNQVWMAENLNVSRFRNGDLIKEAKTYQEWTRASIDYEPAWCYYENIAANGPKYGKLYNWYAVGDPRGLTPEGWEIPFVDEWQELSDKLGGNEVSGKKLKSKEGWEIGGNGVDEVGFKALPYGKRDNTGGFEDSYPGQRATWWTSMPSFSRHSWYFGLVSTEDRFSPNSSPQGMGYSVRGIKRKKIQPELSGPEIGEVKDIDGNTYKTVTIGQQTWMASNLKTTKFSNGDAISNLALDRQWELATKPAWSYQNNKQINNEIHGKLYNWYVVNDTRNCCPTGWRVPTESDFNILINNLGGSEAAGGKLKQDGISNWFPPNVGATNQSKFNGLPSAYRYDFGAFDDFGYGGGFWVKDNSVKWFILRYNTSKFEMTNFGTKNGGISIRCIKN